MTRRLPIFIEATDDIGMQPLGRLPAHSFGTVEMIVEAEVRYRATVRLAGERTGKLRIVQETAPFKIAAHDAAEAAVVCTWNAPAGFSPIRGDRETMTSEVLAVGDGFYRKVGGRPADAAGLRRLLDKFGVFEAGDRDDFDLAVDTHMPARVIDLSKAIVAEIEPYDRSRWVGRFEQRLAGFALVDGRLFRRQSEPVLVAGANSGGLPGKAHMERIGRTIGTPTVVAAWSADVDDGSRGRGVFRLDRLDDAVAYAAAYAGMELHTVKVEARFELHAPELLRIDDEVFALAASARQAVRHLTGDLHWLPRPAVDAAFDLRDMLSRPELDRDMLQDAFERVVENVRPIVEDPNSDRDREHLRNVIEEMDEAADRLAANRPSIDTAPGLIGP